MIYEATNLPVYDLFPLRTLDTGHLSLGKLVILGREPLFRTSFSSFYIERSVSSDICTSIEYGDFLLCSRHALAASSRQHSLCIQVRVEGFGKGVHIDFLLWKDWTYLVWAVACWDNTLVGP